MLLRGSPPPKYYCLVICDQYCYYLLTEKKNISTDRRVNMLLSNDWQDPASPTSPPLQHKIIVPNLTSQYLQTL